MALTGRIVEVAVEGAALLPERGPGYQAKLVEALAMFVNADTPGAASPTERRRLLEQRIVGVAQMVLASREGEQR